MVNLSWEQLAKVPWLDYVCPGAVSVALVAAVGFGRKVYWTVDAVTTFSAGLVLLIGPQFLFGFQVTGGQLDHLHLLLCRVVGAFLVGTAVNWYLMRDSSDRRMMGNQFYARILMCTLMLIAQFYSAYHLWNRSGKRFNTKFLLLSGVGVFAWLLGSSFQLYRLKEMGGYAFKPSWLHTGMILDHFVFLIAGVLNFAFPTQILKTLIKTTGTTGYTIDGVHVCLHRCVAAMILATSISSMMAPSYLHGQDKKAHVIGRLVTQVLVFAGNLYGHFILDIYTMFNVTPMMISGFYITFILSLYFRLDKEKQK